MVASTSKAAQQPPAAPAEGDDDDLDFEDVAPFGGEFELGAEDDHDDLGFGLWCAVCDKRIERPPLSTSANGAAGSSSQASSSNNLRRASSLSGSAEKPQQQSARQKSANLRRSLSQKSDDGGAAAAGHPALTSTALRRKGSGNNAAAHGAGSSPTSHHTTAGERTSTAGGAMTGLKKNKSSARLQHHHGHHFGAHGHKYRNAATHGYANAANRKSHTSLTALAAMAAPAGKDAATAGKDKERDKAPSAHGSLSSNNGVRRTSSSSVNGPASAATASSTQATGSSSPTIAPAGPPSSLLYCSEECRRADELRSRLSSASLSSDASSSLASSALGGAGSSRAALGAGRRSSSSSVRRSSASYFPSATSSSAGLEDMLTFRRRLRPQFPPAAASAASNSMSPEQLVAAPPTVIRSNSVPTSTAQIGRQSSALSGFRLMTPISPSFKPLDPPGTVPELGVRRPRALRSQSDGSPSHSPAHTPGGSRQRAVGFSPHDEEEDDDDDETLHGHMRIGRRRHRSGRKHGAMLEPQSVPEQRRGFYGRSTSTSRPPSASLAVGDAEGTLRRNTRQSASSASLALLGSSLGKSLDNPAGQWFRPKRTDSTASLTSMNAFGQIASTTAQDDHRALAAPMMTHASSQGLPAVVEMPTSNALPHPSTSPSTPSSAFSAFSNDGAHSHSSTRSTATSAAAHGGRKNTSSSSLLYDQHGNDSDTPAGVPANRRTRSSLLMTPSATNVPELATIDTDGVSTHGGGDASATGTPERTPTQSLATLQHAMTAQQHDLPQEQNQRTVRPHHRSHRHHSHAREAQLSAILDNSPAAARHGDAHPVSHASVPSSTAHPRLHSSHSHHHAHGHKHKRTNSHGAHTSSSTGALAAPPLNRALSSLQAEEGAGNAKRNNWSWDHLPSYVPTYTALNVNKGRGEDSQGAATAQAAPTSSQPPSTQPQQVQQPQRKKLFYFDD